MEAALDLSRGVLYRKRQAASGGRYTETDGYTIGFFGPRGAPIGRAFRRRLRAAIRRFGRVPGRLCGNRLPPRLAARLPEGPP